MTSSQVVLVAVTSSLVTVFAMLLVASIRRARPRVPMPALKPREEPAAEVTEPEPPKAPPARKTTSVQKTSAKKTTAKKTSAKKPTAKKPAARKTTKTTKKRT